MSWLDSVARVAVASALLGVPAKAADEVEIEIQLVEMDAKLADLLEERLAAGGEQAEAVHRKLPELKRGGKIRQNDTIRFTTRSGQRGREGAEFRNDDGSATKEGFFAEHDVVTSADGSAAEVNFFFERASKDRDGAMVVRQTVTAFTLERGAAEVIERYDRGDRSEVYLATASKREGAAAEAKEERTRARASAEIYKMRDAKAAADVVAAGGDAGLAKAKADGELIYAMAKSVRSGQRVKGHEEIFLPRKRRDPRGVQFEAEVLVGRGTIDVSATVDFAPWEKDGVGGTAEVAGLVKNGGALLKQFGATPYVVAVRVKAQGGLIDSEPAAPLVASKPPAGQGPDALYVVTYPVQPQFLRALAKAGRAPAGNGGIQRTPSAKELLLANGVEFPDGASVFFNPSTSSLVARQNEAGHAAIVVIVNGLEL